MWESGYSLPACVLSAGLMVFDNAHDGTEGEVGHIVFDVRVADVLKQEAPIEAHEPTHEGMPPVVTQSLRKRGAL
jgi:hypothetical protein